MEKIVVLDGYTLNPGDLSWDGISKLGELTVYDRTPSGKTVERIGDASIVLTNKTPIDRAVMEACPDMRYIGVLATGYNIIDTAAASEKGVTVTNVPAYSTQSVAQLTFALLLELCNRVGLHSDSVHAGTGNPYGDFCYYLTPQTELAGKTLGVVGFGRIGRAVAKIAMAMGMEVVYYNRREVPGDGAKAVSFGELLKRSDVVTLHCPQTAGNLKMINAETIAKMKTGAMLINDARGGLVDERALADALIGGKLAGAAVDVLSSEPISQDNPLLTAPNCIITPHIAWASTEARVRLMKMTEENLKAYLAGDPVNTVV
ncbi:MAG: D-2-hydroxyacid dehydrogenase [Clostridia bacterium]|nr:D-2-hydroxyacid dehydrogenase [Clostridia bacterium]